MAQKLWEQNEKIDKMNNRGQFSGERWAEYPDELFFCSDVNDFRSVMENEIF